MKGFSRFIDKLQMSTQAYTALLETMTGFQGRRNTVLTLVIPKAKYDLAKYLDGLERQVRAIKHANKRFQIIQVLNVVREQIAELNDLQKAVKEHSVIIACGHRLEQDPRKDRPFFCYLVLPDKAIDPITHPEYYYDYTFHTARIRELLNSDVIARLQMPDETRAFLDSMSIHIKGTSQLIALGSKEIQLALEMRVVNKLYVLPTREDLVNNDKLIENLRQASAQMIICYGDDNKRFLKDYSGCIAYLKYPLDMAMLVDKEEPE